MIGKAQAKRRARHLFRACLVKSVLDENRVRLVVRETIAAGLRDSRAILEHLLRLVRLDRSQHTASVESAAPLSAELQAATQAGLTRLYGPTLTMSFSHRPSLIGGMRIQVGSDVYDGTVLAGLAALEKTF